MPITPNEKNKIDAEYKAWLKTDDYKNAKFPSAANTDQGAEERRIAFGIYLGGNDRASHSAFTKGALTDKAMLEVIRENSKEKGFIDTTLEFLGKNKFGLGAAMLALITGNAMGIGMLGTLAITGVALAAGSGVGDEKGMLNTITGRNQVNAPTAAIYKSKDSKSMPVMQELIEIGDVKTEHDYKHEASVRKLTRTDIAPTSQDVDHVTRLTINKKEIVAYGKVRGDKFDVKYIEVGDTKDTNKIVLREIPDSTGSITLDMYGDKIKLSTDTAKQIAKAHNTIIEDISTKPQEAATEITVKQGKSIDGLTAGKEYILNVTNEKDEVVARMGGRVTDNAKTLVIDSSTGLVEGAPLEKLDDPKAGLKMFYKHVHTSLEDSAAVDTLVQNVQIANKVSLRPEREVTLKDIKVEGVTADKPITNGQEVSISGTYMTSTGYTATSLPMPTRNPERTFNVKGTIQTEGDGAEQKQYFVIAKDTTITGPEFNDAGQANVTTTKDIKVDITGLDLAKADSHEEFQKRLMLHKQFAAEMKGLKTEAGVLIADSGMTLPDNLRGDLATRSSSGPVV